jgi:hypothetical protein
MEYPGRVSILFMAAVIIMFSRNIFAAKYPCDLHDSAGTPCVAAHSMVRALYGSYDGPLYQVRRTPDNKTMDIGVLAPGGFADAAVQDSFLKNASGTISIIYDQSPKGNHLKVAPGGRGPLLDLRDPCKEADAKALKLKVNGHSVYGLSTTSRQGYRNDNATGLAIGDEPEGMYMVTSGKHVSDQCCFDYGNACRNDSAGANGTLETIYFGTCNWWTSGSGNGPWVMADLENGLYTIGADGGNQNSKSLPYEYVTAMLKGKAGRMALKGGNAQSGSLQTMYDGTRPLGYEIMRKEGAIVLGIGGDNSNWGFGTFFEGCITTGYPSETVEDLVQADIVAAGYGSSVVPAVRGGRPPSPSHRLTVRYNKSTTNAVITCAVPEAGRLCITIVDQRGRRVAEVVNDAVPPGRYQTVWNCWRVPSGIYLWRLLLDGKDGEAGRIVIGK